MNTDPTHAGWTDSSTTRRRVLAGLGAGLVVGLAGCTAGARPGRVEGVVGATSLELADVPHYVAVEELLATVDDGVGGSIQNLTSTTLQMQALLGGDVHVYTSGPGALFQAAAAGNDLRIVGTKLAGTDYAIALREDVASLASFVDPGLRMGVSSIGGLSYVQTVGMLQAAGVDPAGVTFVTVGGSSDRMAALVAGRIDGCPLHESQIWRLREEGASVKNGGNVREFFPTYVENTVAVAADWLDSAEGERFVRAYVDALTRANRRATEDFEWLYAKASEYQADPLPEAKAREEWELFRSIGRWPHEPLDRSAYDDALRMLDAAGLIDADAVDLDAMVRPEYVEAATATP